VQKLSAPGFDPEPTGLHSGGSTDLKAPAGWSPVGTGVTSPPPGQNPTCAIHASGSPEQIGRTATLRWLDPRLCQSRRWKLEPRFCRQRCPIRAPLRLLTPTLQRPSPGLSGPPPDAVQRLPAEVEPEVLVEAVEHFRQMCLL